MQPQPIESLERPPSDPIAVNNGVLVLTGYGLDIRVERGQLQVRDGIGRQRREGQIHRATGRLRRIVVLGHTGAITLEAIRWLADIGAGYVQIDRDGRVLAAFGPLGTDRPGLRRAQARAQGEPAGNTIARELLIGKLREQTATLQELDANVVVDGPVTMIENLIEALSITPDVDGLRLVESRAAAAYWGVWSDLPVRFARRDAERIPAHWWAFGLRTSPLTGSPRLATNPANAVLNYLYAILEGEAAIAARIVGLDPGLGVIHADQPNRDSLAADLMEPIRPIVDRFVAEFLARRVFAARDFFETREGVCRVTAPLARELAATAREWGRLVGTVAEDVAQRLVGHRQSQAATTPISGRSRRAARPVGHRHRHPVPVRVRRSCIVCGAPAVADRRTCRGACETAERTRKQEAFVTAGSARLRTLHMSGQNPGMTVPGRTRLAATQTERIQAARTWQRNNPKADPETYRTQVLPLLGSLSAGAIARATGLSVGYSAKIGRGEVTPHPMWWEMLAQTAARSEA